MLGFTPYTRLNIAGAAQLLLDYQSIINTKLADMTHFPPESHATPELRGLALGGEVGSFEQ